MNKPTPLDLTNGGGDSQRDIDRTFESAGLAGGIRVFHYSADEINRTLYLQDKYNPNPIPRNRAAGVGGAVGPMTKNNADNKNNNLSDEYWIPKEALANIGDVVYKVNKKAVNARRIQEYIEFANSDEQRKRMILNYDTNDGGRIILSGIDENKDSIYVVLDRINRKYVLTESSLKAGEY